MNSIYITSDTLTLVIAWTQNRGSQTTENRPNNRGQVREQDCGINLLIKI